jgi:hypothetical protein
MAERYPLAAFFSFGYRNEKALRKISIALPVIWIILGSFALWATIDAWFLHAKITVR